MCLRNSLCDSPHCSGSKHHHGPYTKHAYKSLHALLVSSACGATEVRPHRPTGRRLGHRTFAQPRPAQTPLPLPPPSNLLDGKRAKSCVNLHQSQRRAKWRRTSLIAFYFPLFVLAGVWARSNNEMKYCEPCRQV